MARSHVHFLLISAYGWSPTRPTLAPSESLQQSLAPPTKPTTTESLPTTAIVAAPLSFLFPFEVSQPNRFWSRHHSNTVRICFLGEATSVSSVSACLRRHVFFSIASHRTRSRRIAQPVTVPPSAFSPPPSSPNFFLLDSFVLYLGIVSRTAKRVPFSRKLPLS